MSDEDEKKRLLKEAWKEAFKEIMLAEYASIGRWTVRLFVMGVIGLVAYLILWRMGWTPPDGPLKP
jgi:hypothetical protein